MLFPANRGDAAYPDHERQCRRHQLLSDPTADLQILARLINLSGPAGRDALPTFSSANFAILQVPEPATLLLMAMAGAGSAYRYARRRRRNQEIF